MKNVPYGHYDWDRKTKVYPQWKRERRVHWWTLGIGIMSGVLWVLTGLLAREALTDKSHKLPPSSGDYVNKSPFGGS